MPRLRIAVMLAVEAFLKLKRAELRVKTLTNVLEQHVKRLDPEDLAEYVRLTSDDDNEAQGNREPR